MRHTLARCRHDEIKKAHLPFPTLPLFAAWLHWSSRTVPLYGSYSCDKHRATITDIAQAFRGRIWAERIYIAGVMSDCHPMNGSVRLQTHIGSARTLQVAYPEAPPMPARVTLGR